MSADKCLNQQQTCSDTETHFIELVYQKIKEKTGKWTDAPT